MKTLRKQPTLKGRYLKSCQGWLVCVRTQDGGDASHKMRFIDRIESSKDVCVCMYHIYGTGRKDRQTELAKLLDTRQEATGFDVCITRLWSCISQVFPHYILLLRFGMVM